MRRSLCARLADARASAPGLLRPHRTPRPSFPSSRVPASAATVYADERGFAQQRGLTPHSPVVRPSLRYANGPFAAQAKARYDYLEKE